jgi:hypothetical protein
MWPRWPHGPSRMSWPLGSWVWIPLGTRMFVSCVYMLCCPVSVEAFAANWSLAQRSPIPCLIRFTTPPPPKKGIGKVNRRSNPKKYINYILILVFRQANRTTRMRYGLINYDSCPYSSTRRSRFDPRRKRKDFSSSLCVQTSSGAHPASCTMGTAGPFPWGRARPGRDADHSHPSTAEVENR